MSWCCPEATRVETPSAVSTYAPSAALRAHVGGYWLAHANADARHCVIPDGSLDVVLEFAGGRVRSWVYGTTSRPVDFAIEPGAHYLGIRFRPGQSRHFLALAADELTDRRAPADDLLRTSLDPAQEESPGEGTVRCIDGILARHLARLQPGRTRIDEAIAAIEGGGPEGVRVREIAACHGGSQRQFERVFRATVGVPARQFASIHRYRRAAALIARGMPLAEAAAEAGYADQSHMSNEFRRLAGASPGRFAPRRVDFLQD